MPDRATLARMATRAALQTRRSLSISRDQPVNAFDLAERLGVEVRFLDTPSLEGMFSRAPHPIIVLPSTKHRPRGRLAFTCAHELGHSVLGHGERVDKLLEQPRERHNPEEYAADVFAGSLLMPRAAVQAACARRELTVETATPEQLFAISCELGVGYATLVKHVGYGLQMATDLWMNSMLKTGPKAIRRELLDRECSEPLVVLDQAFSASIVDAEVGELLASSAPLIDGADTGASTLVEDMGFQTREAMYVYRAVRPGQSDVVLAPRHFQLRVSRAGYCGRQRHRFLADPEEEQ